MRTLLLHIGMERAASTSLQSALFNFRELLPPYGARYISDHTGNCSDLAYCFGSNPQFDFKERFGVSSGEIPELKCAIISRFSDIITDAVCDGNVHNFVMSSEHFFSRVVDERCIEELFDFLKPHFDQIQLFLVVRDRISFVRSLYSIALINGHNLSYRDFARFVLSDRRYFPVSDMICKWESVFNCHVNLIPFQSFVNGLHPARVVFQDYLNFGDIHFSGRENKSLSRIKLKLLRFANKWFPNYSGWTDPPSNSLIGRFIRRIIIGW